MAARANGSPASGRGRRSAWPVALLYNPRLRSVLFQALLAFICIYLLYWAIINAQDRLTAQRLSFGLGFLDRTAGFGISQTLIDYSETSTYWRVFQVGVLNTLLVGAIAVVFATILGFVMGVARLSSNWMIARIATVYVEVMRNLPPLFHVLFWYVAVLSALPSARNSFSFGEIAFLNIRGLYVPRMVLHEGAVVGPVSVLVALAAIVLLSRWAKKRQERTGRTFPTVLVGLAVLITVPPAALAVAGFPISFEYPVLRGFNFAGGVRLIPEFVALTAALAIYTGGFIAEIVRAGILAVSHGQTEAARALGMRAGPTMRLIIIPQAMRVIVPPLTSQYLNLIKNSSLAVAIGYPDLVAVFAGTALNQSGQAIEIIAITMVFYLVISLIVSALMNIYNRRAAPGERWAP